MRFKALLISIFVSILLVFGFGVSGQSSSFWYPSGSPQRLRPALNIPINIPATGASSTAANGWDISAGCYAINGTCIDDDNIARVLTVDTLGNGDYTTVGDAASAASAGDLIYVQPGTYTETGTITLPTQVSLVCSNPSNTIITAAATPLISLDSTSTIAYCDLRSTAADSTGIKTVSAAGGPIVWGLNIIGNRITAKLKGIEALQNGYDSVFRDNEIYLEPTSSEDAYGIKANWNPSPAEETATMQVKDNRIFIERGAGAGQNIGEHFDGVFTDYNTKVTILSNQAGASYGIQNSPDEMARTLGADVFVKNTGTGDATGFWDWGAFLSDTVLLIDGGSFVAKTNSGAATGINMTTDASGGDIKEVIGVRVYTDSTSGTELDLVTNNSAGGTLRIVNSSYNPTKISHTGSNAFIRSPMGIFSLPSLTTSAINAITKAAGDMFHDSTLDTLVLYGNSAVKQTIPAIEKDYTWTGYQTFSYSGFGPPFAVGNATKITNLNADLLDGYTTGISGGTIPLLSGVNTWSDAQTFSDDVTVSGTAGIKTDPNSSYGLNINKDDAAFRGINFSGSVSTQANYGLYNTMSSSDSRGSNTGVYNKIDSTGGGGFGVKNVMTLNAGSQNSYGLYNDITVAGASAYSYGSYNWSKATNNALSEIAIGSKSFITTYSGASDLGYGFAYEVCCDSTGGVQYGFFADADWENPILNEFYGVYVKGAKLHTDPGKKFAFYAADMDSYFNGGIIMASTTASTTIMGQTYLNASTTIGAGTNGSGLTVAGGATTTNATTTNAYVSNNLEVDGELQGSRSLLMFHQTSQAADRYIAVASAAYGADVGQPMPRSGSIVGMSVNFKTGTLASGDGLSVDVQVRKNDVTVLNILFDPIASATVYTDHVNQARGTDTFAADDLIQVYSDVEWASGGLTPITVLVELQFDS